MNVTSTKTNLSRAELEDLLDAAADRAIVRNPRGRGATAQDILREFSETHAHDVVDQLHGLLIREGAKAVLQRRLWREHVRRETDSEGES
jgi:hypothetical protein